MLQALKDVNEEFQNVDNQQVPKTKNETPKGTGACQNILHPF